MTVYDVFYEGPNGEVFNCHDAAHDARDAAVFVADLIEEGTPWLEVEIRRTPAEIDAMLARRKAATA